jgi:nitroreductase
MDTYKCIVTKRDTRSYADKAISEETVSRILQAGRMAGSSKNSQPCRFVVLEKETRKKELAACGQFAAHIPSAPVVIAVVLQPDGGAFDAGRAAQNMMVAAWNEGITSCPVSMHDADCARRVLGLPEGHRVAIVLSFGYPEPAAARSMGRPRIALEELVRRDRW